MSVVKENQNYSDNSEVNRNTKRLKVLIACVLLVASIAALVISYVDSKLNMIDYTSADDEWIVVSDAAVSDADFEKYDPVAEGAEVVLPEGDVHKDKDVLNILLLGTDERKKEFSTNARSDAMLVISLNKKTNSVKLVSLERGMAVTMPNGEIDLLTHSFRYGGPQWVLSCVQSHFNLDIDKYVRVNFNVFEGIVDAVGGVDIDLTQVEADALNHDVETNTFPLSRRVHAGTNHLNGYEALQYCRLRYTDSDWVRIERQRKTISAIQKECRDLSIGQLDDLADAVLPMIQTNLEKSELLSLMASAPKFINAEIEDMTIPAKGTYSSLSRVDFQENSRILHEFFYGESEE